jgi:hypothetical protein
MTEIETLRKELNELRERIAILERDRVLSPAIGPRKDFRWPNQIGYPNGDPYLPPYTIPNQPGYPNGDPYLPPYTITCGSDK